MPDFDTVYAETAALCETDVNPQNETTLADWMREGNWQEIAPVVLAAMWDEINKKFKWEVRILNDGEVEVYKDGDTRSEGRIIGSVKAKWYWVAYTMALEMVDAYRDACRA